MKLKLENINFKFNDLIILKNTSYTFKENKIYGLLGNNGVGKTTLFNLMKSRYKYSGSIKLNKKDIKNKEIMLINSTPTLPEFMTGKEYISYFLKLTNNKNKDIDYYFNLVKLDNNAQDKLIKDYSHGMKNKLEFISVMILNPKVILLDEPMSNLDVLSQEEIKDMLKMLKKNHIIIMSTHIIDYAINICDEIILMSDNKLNKVNKNKEEIVTKLKGVYDDQNFILLQ